jgi:hypothetical protein
MFDVIKPLPGPSLLYKCRDCGHKFKPLLVFFPKKCLICGGGNIKLAIGIADDGPLAPVVN